MECNKDEALRAKEICEAKLAEKDFIGAKKFALKADKLFNGLEDIPQLLVILDIYISSEKKIHGEPDWYGVLGVGPTSDDETIKKNFKKLALYLHPDKNKTVGAEGAFKLVSQGWTLLSNSISRKVYDQKRNPKPVYQPVNITKPVQTIPRPPNTPTFWTSCVRCSMRYEYSKEYLNKKIICPSCSDPFWAIESPSLPMKRHPTMHSQKQNSNPSSVSHVNVQTGPGVNQFKNRHAAKASAMRYQAADSGLGSVKSGAILKRKRAAEPSSTVHVGNAYAKVNSVGKKVNFSNSRRELTQAEVRVMLMTKARKEIVKKIDEWNLETASKKETVSKNEVEEIIVTETSKGKDVKPPLTNNTNEDDVDANVDDADVNDADMDADTNATLMSVPDPDFHDFDNDRTERSFGENQVWAAYDEDDGMPRYYAMIHNVISKKPFKMEISWLNSKGNAELGPINWVSSGFPKTSGEFRIRKREVNTSLNSFSHRVKWVKGKKGVIQIYPKKGNVWALYRNWSPDWTEFTPDEVIHKYDMVTVLEDYNEEKVVVVAPLVKVSGFKSVFRLHADVTEARTIPRDEIFRLSHQVPFYVLTGEESVNVPEGCLELDPAALPLELLKTTVEPVKTEVKEVKTYFRKNRKNGKVQ
ncbi:uncharacterized protein LOC143529841 [Bidens hawaiensis]|uniref:uncharacterized protein LOC143529841 n=1 Tax=Bidens hawaiensis TaxID=980011 RepID=UPI00404B7FF8